MRGGGGNIHVSDGKDGGMKLEVRGGERNREDESDGKDGGMKQEVRGGGRNIHVSDGKYGEMM